MVPKRLSPDVTLEVSPGCSGLLTSDRWRQAEGSFPPAENSLELLPCVPPAAPMIIAHFQLVK